MESALRFWLEVSRAAAVKALVQAAVTSCLHGGQGSAPTLPRTAFRRLRGLAGGSLEALVPYHGAAGFSRAGGEDMSGGGLPKTTPHPDYTQLKRITQDPNDQEAGIIGGHLTGCLPQYSSLRIIPTDQSSTHCNQDHILQRRANISLYFFPPFPSLYHTVRI